jgi:hypothetical protein
MTGTHSAKRLGGEPARAPHTATLCLPTAPEGDILAGSGRLAVTFAANGPGLLIAGIASIDEATLVDGQWIATRLNGDENAQGQLLLLNASDLPQDDLWRAFVSLPLTCRSLRRSFAPPWPTVGACFFRLPGARRHFY